MVALSNIIEQHFGKPDHSVDFRDRYNFIIDLIGYDTCKQILLREVNIQELCKAYKADKNLNNYPKGKMTSASRLSFWDSLGRSMMSVGVRQGAFRKYGGLTSYSLCQLTCTSKEVARRTVEEHKAKELTTSK